MTARKGKAAIYRFTGTNKVQILPRKYLRFPATNESTY